MHNSGEGNLFVTVGTTEFDELVKAIDTIEFAREVAKKFNRLTIQMGRGTYEPKVLKSEITGLSVEVYRFKPTLDDDMKTADLIISHCGAGSILEAVSYGKQLIVVVNNTLQGNHQTELSDAMSVAGYCVSTVPENLLAELEAYNERPRQVALKQHKNSIPITNPGHFQKAISDMFDFAS